ncbi:MAG: cation diffusion facilitator family transporter [Candidatus Woesearchaeota archaeon]
MDKNYRGVVRVLWITFFLNIVVVVFKIVFGLMINSLSMVADGLHSVMDSASNIICLIGLRIASKPADKDHPYGHRKFETLTTIMIAVFLMIASFELLKSSISRFVSGSAPNITIASFVVLAGTLVINFFVATYERKKASYFQSVLLKADSAHTFSDIWVTISVLFGFIFIKMGFPIADSVIALVIAVVIAFSGFKIIRSTTAVLSDAKALDEQDIAAIVNRTDGITGFHKIRTRSLGNETLLDLHIMVRGNTTVRKGHSIAKVLESALKQKFPHVKDITIHVDPHHKVINP